MMTRPLLCLALLLLGPGLARAAPPTQPPAQVSVAKDKLVFFGDGKQHLLALVLTNDSDSPVFWSADGQRFYQLRIIGGGSEGGEHDLQRLDRVFWEPRVTAPYQASFAYKKGEGLTVQCSTRNTALQPLAAAAAATLLQKAQFFAPRWNHYAYALARDTAGRYYYVDNQREPPNSKSFRLWAGLKGAMRPQRMVNVVSDSEGDIFATRSGSLRLVLDKHETSWVKGARKTSLTYLAVEDNHVLIYTDLGVYTGQPLGTPCDDL